MRWHRPSGGERWYLPKTANATAHPSPSCGEGEVKQCWNYLWAVNNQSRTAAIW
jgi:hypothetical protein